MDDRMDGAPQPQNQAWKGFLLSLVSSFHFYHDKNTSHEAGLLTDVELTVGTAMSSRAHKLACLTQPCSLSLRV